MPNPKLIQTAAIMFLALAAIIHIPNAAASDAVLPAETVSYSIRAEIQPSAGSLSAEARIDLPLSKKRFEIRIAGLENVSASIDGRPLKIKPGAGTITAGGGGSLRISYSLSRLDSSANVNSPNPANPGVVRGNIISEAGVSLSEQWYPEVMGAGLARFSLKAVLPEDYWAVSEADEITEKGLGSTSEYSFFFPYPLDGLTLAAGRYKVMRAEHAGVGIYAYFFPEDAELAGQYLEEAARAIDTYQRMLGPFPYRRFSVVENILPTGYSMPTYTLLGSSVVRLPFIAKTSFWHEVLHQWFGNSVFASPGDGNWSEGLSAYMADHRIEELAGNGPAHRKLLLLDFRNYVTSRNDFPLRVFSQRADRASRSIGYGKAAMLFHMLRRELGDELFISGLREFVKEKTGQEASWDDLRAGFERASDRDLKTFFEQWLGRPGYPVFSVRNTAGVLMDGKYKAGFVIDQQGQLWDFGLTVAVRSEGGVSSKTVRVKDKVTHVEMETDGRPIEIIIDPEYDIFRGLLADEAPPVISALLGAQARLVIVPDDKNDTDFAYAPLVKELSALGFNERKESEVKDSELRDASFVIMGQGGLIANMLFGRGESRIIAPGEGFSINMEPNPYSPRRAVGFAYAANAEEAALAAAKLTHYGRYSYLRFSSGRNIEKRIAASEDGMRILLHEPLRGIRTSESLSLEEIFTSLMDADVIYVGERHDRYEDHKLQLDILAGLKARGLRVALGMEMFESSVQNALDAYRSGEASEKDMLLASNYFDTWGMNWHLYRELASFARTEGIPLIGLNQREAVVKKIARGGLDALSKEERSELPDGIDLTDEDYRGTLRDIFFKHSGGPGGPGEQAGQGNQGFINFAQAQIVRDERMAVTLSDFMRKNPGVKVVVAAGQGHVVFGHGIPKRLMRRLPHKYAVVMNAESGEFDPKAADYLVLMKPMTAPQTPVIGVALKDTPAGVLVEGTSPGLSAARAGLKKGDLILSADGADIKRVAELKTALFFKNPGNALRLDIERKRFILSPLRLELELALE